MNRDTVVFSICSFLLGLVIGSLLIGPKLAQRGAPPPGGAPSPSAAPSDNPMDAVRQRITSLKDEIARNPRNADALAELGTIYMVGEKYPQAIEYFEQSLAIRDDPNVRRDLEMCRKQLR